MFFSLQRILLFGRVFLGCIMNMNKNYLFHLTGCAVFLFVGARTQNAKATYPDSGVVEAHWRKNPKVFQKTFETFFPKVKWLPFWGEDFPDWFKKQNGSPCTVKTGFGRLSFHTLNDLEQLPCDADLKKIIKVVGSTEFLTKVLPEEVVKSIFTHAVSGKDFKTKITFIPHSEKNFFNMFGKGELKIQIKQFFKGLEVLNCYFSFAFEKKNRLTVLADYEVSYAITQGESQRRTGVEFLKKTEQLSDFPWDAVKKAKKEFPLMYAKLRDVLKSDLKICSCAESAKKEVMSSNSELLMGYGPFEARPGVPSCPFVPVLTHQSYPEPLLDVLITEDFLKGIFGETFWNILEHYREDARLLVDFHISRYGNGYKVSYHFNRKHRGNMEHDAITFSGEKLEWEWLDFIDFNFVFFYDPEKDEIFHVRLQDKLVLNYEHRFECKTSDGLIVADNEDSKARCYSFEELLKKSGIYP